MIAKLIKRPIAVTMCAIALVVLGVVASILLPISLMPKVDIEQITVKVSAPNISARQLHNSVVVPLRGQLMQTPYLKDIEAVAVDGGATILMRFDYGTDINYTFIDVNERLDRTMNMLPSGIERPIAIKASASDIPAFFLNVSLKDTVSNQAKIMEMGGFARSVIAKRLEQLEQVAFVDISGRNYAQVVIRANNNLLSALDKDISIIEKAILAANIELGNLTIKDGQYQYSVRFSSSISSVEQIESLVVNIDGRLYRLAELASIVVEPQPRKEIVRSDGNQAVIMAIIKQSDARMDDLQSAVGELITQMERDYPELKLDITRDQTQLLNYSIGNLKDNLIIGCLLACFVIILFMQTLRASLLVMVTIPLSLLLSLLLFFSIGISINIVSLSGLMLGLGMMVDNSIIVIDNISQRWDRGVKLEDAVVKGSVEVFSPLFSSVLTTCSIFVPLIFLSGIAGAMFYDQAMAVVVGLFSSLVVAMTVIPVYYYLLYRKHSCRVKNRYLQKYGVGDMSASYERSLHWVFRHQPLLWIGVLVLCVSTIVIFPYVEKRSLPVISKSDMIVGINWNENLSIEDNDTRVLDLISFLGSNLSHSTSIVGRNSFVLSHTAEGSKQEAQLYLCVNNSDSLSYVEHSIGRYVEKLYPAAVVTFSDASNIFDMIFSSDKAALEARLRPTDGSVAKVDKLNLLLNSISAKLGGMSVEPIAVQEHIVLYPSTALMELYKVDRKSLYDAISTAMNERNLLRINQADQMLPLILGSEKETLDDVLIHTTVRSQDGIDIGVGTLIIQSKDSDLKSIVSGSWGDYYPLPLPVISGEEQAVMAKVVDVVRANGGFEVSFDGEWFESRELTNQLAMVLVVSLLLLYFILASQFESFIDPIIILSEIVVDLFGAIFLLWICDESINLMSMIGMIVMSGIVINDSILKVDTFNRLRRGGCGTLRAILQGGKRRLKPIIMTSLTTIMAIIPFLFALGMGSDLQRPLSIAIIGGMVVGTLFSIYGVPVIYYYIYRRR